MILLGIGGGFNRITGQINDFLPPSWELNRVLGFRRRHCSRKNPVVSL